jgi:hypothetical protein
MGAGQGQPRVARSGSPHSRRRSEKVGSKVHRPASATLSVAPRASGCAVRWSPAQTSEVFDTYWRFAAERQAVYFRRLQNGLSGPWTSDPILAVHRFTNAYRAADRVSQYLIREVIYRGDPRPEEVVFRILLFKLFNKIETWQLLTGGLREIRYETFRVEAYDAVLSRAMDEGQRVYSGAYIMPSSPGFGNARKHRNHLSLLEAMMRGGLTRQIAQARSLQDVFDALHAFPGIGDFLAYQFAIDLNYSELVDFSEGEFVVPGPGARDGIHKCFRDRGGLSEAEIIRLVADRQDEEFNRLGLAFPTLWGRRLQLIDCQNLFCEVDKYARLAHPDVPGLSGRTKIKQRYRFRGPLGALWFPPKWGINEKIPPSLRRPATPVPSTLPARRPGPASSKKQQPSLLEVDIDDPAMIGTDLPPDRITREDGLLPLVSTAGSHLKA